MGLSKGALKLREVLSSLYPGLSIIEEYSVGSGLRLDFYLPDLKLGYEYHGRQHSEFVEHFHGDASGFAESKMRDSLKYELCAQQRIALVVVWFDEDITSELILSRSKEALSNIPDIKPTKEKYKEPEDIKKKRLQKAKEFRRKRYLEMKRYKEKLNEDK